MLRELDDDHRPSVRVIVRMPVDAEERRAWEAAAPWDALASLPNASIVRDVNGAIARAFGAPVSGTVLVYAPTGDCRFRGGVTASRAHRGPSPGQNELRDVLQGTRTMGTAPVFGCPLVEDAACCASALEPCPDEESS